MDRKRQIGAVVAAAVVAGGLSLPFVSQLASAQSAAGTVTGQVVWNTVFVRCAFPGAASSSGVGVPQLGDQGQGAVSSPPADNSTPAGDAPASGGIAGSGSASGGSTPGTQVRPRAIPAGAVLVAVQGTSISTRTDENGKFTLSGVPGGQFLTVAAGPVSGAGNAWALQPNVQVSAGQSVDLGQLSLGTTTGGGPICPPIAVPLPGAAPDTAPAAPPSSTP